MDYTFKKLQNSEPIASTWTVNTITNAQVFKLGGKFVIQINEGVKQVKIMTCSTYQRAMKLSMDHVTAKGVK